MALQAGIHGQPGPGTDRSKLVRDFQNFVGRSSEILKVFLIREQTVLVRGFLITGIMLKKYTDAGKQSP